MICYPHLELIQSDKVTLVPLLKQDHHELYYNYAPLYAINGFYPEIGKPHWIWDTQKEKRIVTTGKTYTLVNAAVLELRIKVQVVSIDLFPAWDCDNLEGFEDLDTLLWFLFHQIPNRKGKYNDYLMDGIKAVFRDKQVFLLGVKKWVK